MFNTSNGQIGEIAEREGYRAKVYRPIPGKNAKGEWNSSLTGGYGQEGALFPGTPGEIKIVEGLVIDRETAWNALCFFVYNVVDPMVTEYCNPQTQAEHDACASWVYNIRHSRLKKDEYTFPKLVRLADRSPEHMDRIINCLLEYCLTPGAETGLFRRRLVEALDFQGLPTTPEALGFIQSARVSRLDGGQVMGNAAWVHPTGKYCATVDPGYVFQVAEGVKQKTEDEVTADLNAAQLEKLRGKPAAPSAKPVAAKKPAPVPLPQPKPLEAPAVTRVPTPQVNVTAAPKPMEESKTHKGLSKAESGKETVIIGTTVTGIGALLPNVSALTNYLQQFPTETILKTVAIIGVVVIVVGLWRWYAGRMIAYDGRVEATQTKV